MSEVKIFRIKGRIRTQNYKTEFSKDISSVTSEAAIEKIYANLGSQHRAKRAHIRIDSIEEIRREESTDMLIRQLNEVR
jgi:large subunit ribosomal protein LX